MRAIFIAVSFVLLHFAVTTPLRAAGTAEVPDHIKSAIDNPERGQEARGRDAGRRPGEVLAFYGIEPGMTVLEIGAGGGYYTELLSHAVGPEGKVIAQNSPGEFYEKFIKARFVPIVEKLENVEAAVAAVPDIGLAAGSIDAAFIILIYHHMHFDPESGEALPDRTVETLDAIHRALKPGGILGIIEHAAPDGMGRAASAEIHRVDEQSTIADITGRGFELAATSDLLHVASDDRTVYWRNTPHQGKTWRLMHKYRKPAD